MILAHDLGTTGDKAALYSADGALVAAATARYGTDYGPGGRVEQDPADWWRGIVESTRELLERTGVRPEEIACVSFSGQMMGAVLLDGRGEPVRPGADLGRHALRRSSATGWSSASAWSAATRSPGTGSTRPTR